VTDMFARPFSPALVGREEELSSLLEAASHPPALILVEGEAGVGKTRLVQEFLRSSELEARQLYSGNCQHLAEPLPLAPVLDALRTSRPVRTEMSPVVGALSSTSGAVLEPTRVTVPTGRYRRVTFRLDTGIR
jgi:hypothetical protein